MGTYLIGYDLNRPRKADDYPNLIAAVKALGGWWHYLDSTWIVKSNHSVAQIRDHLSQYIDQGDELLVVGLSGSGAWRGFTNSGSQWLKDNL